MTWPRSRNWSSIEVAQECCFTTYAPFVLFLSHQLIVTTARRPLRDAVPFVVDWRGHSCLCSGARGLLCSIHSPFSSSCSAPACGRAGDSQAHRCRCAVARCCFSPPTEPGVRPQRSALLIHRFSSDSRDQQAWSGFSQGQHSPLPCVSTGEVARRGSEGLCFWTAREPRGESAGQGH